MIAASELERHMLTLINADRQAVGIDPLALETNLNQSAEDHSIWMLAADQFSHSGEGGSSPTERIVEADFDLSGSWRTAENIAIRSEQGDNGYLDEVEALHEGLMDSPGHRANLLNPDLKYIGIGVEVGDYNFGGGETEAVVVTQNFANTQGTVDLDTEGPVGPDEQVPDEDPPVEDPPTDEMPEEEQPEEEPEEEQPDEQVPDEETPEDDYPEDEPPLEDPMPNPDPELADCDVQDDFLPEVLRMDIAEWLIEALTPILAALSELDPSFDLVEFDFGHDGDAPVGSPWPDAGAPCPEVADNTDQEGQSEVGLPVDATTFELPTCDVFWLYDAA